MNKCPRCGYIEIYWRPLRFNPDVDYAHPDNVPFANEIPRAQKHSSLSEREGWVYWWSGNYIQRLPIERYLEWGRRTHPKGTYTESFKSRQKKELELNNSKLLGRLSH